MKILHYAEYISIDADKEFSRNITGYGYMVIDIANSIAKEGVYVDLLTFSGITKGKKYKNINLLTKTWLKIFLSINYKDLFISIVKTMKHVPKNNKKRVILGYLMLGFFQKTIKLQGYDLIHFHGISPVNDILIQYCLKDDIKCIITLHGLNALTKSPQVTDYQAKTEILFLKKAYLEKIPITVVSQGIKKEIIKFLQVEKVENISTILNACVGTKRVLKNMDIYQKYNIGKTRKIALCVGNFSENKNQMQVARAYSKINEIDRMRFVILFIGNPSADSKVQSFINESKLNNDLIICGAIPKNTMSNYYAMADFTILGSIQEGFGLSIIEGFVYGLPSLTFEDLDAIDDIYDEKAMITLKVRDDKTFAGGMVDMIDKDWNKDFILNYAQKFSLEKMAQTYIYMYKKVLDK